jgi:ABC-type multidrug transport system fused ATPase/permease subunit
MVATFLHFLPLSQNLRRLEMTSLSPLFANFGELLHGLTTVRAFKVEKQFQDRITTVVDTFQGMDHFFWSLQAWLVHRCRTLSGLSEFALTALALYSGLTPGLTAFMLIAAEQFVTATFGLCQKYGTLMMEFISVERVEELLHIDQEPRGSAELPDSWPKFGADIEFRDATIRYAAHFDPALSNISLTIPGGSTTAVLGRTGSGKSTLASALLNVVRPEAGQILIDGIALSNVDPKILRSRLTYIPQDPALFSGTIRHNLDPQRDFSDAECDVALQRVCGRHGWSLSTHVESGGKNLSHGQRQLICIARAVLRRSSIVILDEATASIDLEGSMEIQGILREEMRAATVITIAHRLEAVKDADYCVVLENGRVLSQGPASAES